MQNQIYYASPRFINETQQGNIRNYKNYLKQRQNKNEKNKNEKGIQFFVKRDSDFRETFKNHSEV